MRTLIVAAMVLSGCGLSQGEINSGADTRGEDSAELSTVSRTLVALRRDLRKCASPVCGGYFVHDVNRVNLTETYVSGLDFSSSTLGDREQQQIIEAADGEVVLRGKLGPKDSHNIRPFIVSDAWRGLPGAALATGDLVFSMKPANIECFAAPCASFQAKKGNATTTTLFHQLDTTGAASFVDSGWLLSQASTGGALVAGAIAPSTDPSGLSIKVLQAKQVFLALPVELELCSHEPPPSCSSNQVRPYVRGDDLCLQAQACVSSHVCNYAVPTCGAGYTVVQFTGTNACPHVECDPSWIYE